MPTELNLCYFNKHLLECFPMFVTAQNHNNEFVTVIAALDA
jgi:hypothetical protein